MGVSFNEEQDSDGTLFLTLNEIKEWSPAAKNGEVKSGWQLMEVDDQRLVNAGFNKLKEILGNYDKKGSGNKKQIKLMFREIQFEASMAYKKETRKGAMRR